MPDYYFNRNLTTSDVIEGINLRLGSNNYKVFRVQVSVLFNKEIPTYPRTFRIWYIRSMLQNRVNPLGEIIRTAARGAWMGNRGLLHNDKREIVRPFRLLAWITCVLEFKNRKRIVMSPGLYTELFFLDEATAFAAGHRPCFECRREDHFRFKKYWLLGNADYHFNEKTSINEIDTILHCERMRADKSKVTFQSEISQLPHGTFILLNEKPFLIKGDGLYEWTPTGYDTGIDKPATMVVNVLTPASIVNTFKAGYVPQMGV